MQPWAFLHLLHGIFGGRRWEQLQFLGTPFESDAQRFFASDHGTVRQGCLYRDGYQSGNV